MTPREVTEFFDEYVRGFMKNDIGGANNIGANFLVALGLSDYTEVLGGLVTGDLKVKRKAAANYRAFLPYLGDYYVSLNQQIDLYDRVRCGLAHEYFIKGDAIIARSLVDPNGKPDKVPGILYIDKSAIVTIQTDAGPRQIPEDTIVFGTRNYARDFANGCETYYSELIAEFKFDSAQQKLLPAFVRTR